MIKTQLESTALDMGQASTALDWHIPFSFDLKSL
jgi:hypothetical protein